MIFPVTTSVGQRIDVKPASIQAQGHRPIENCYRELLLGVAVAVLLNCAISIAYGVE